jgi:hypothetical protein
VEKELGCCGYDELGPNRPEESRPLVYGLKTKALQSKRETDGPRVARSVFSMGQKARYPVVNGR